jgi:hypothetical protein
MQLKLKKKKNLEHLEKVVFVFRKQSKKSY